jgi:hypothetical protein
MEPAWLALARPLIGKPVNPIEPAARIARIWPDMSDYCRTVTPSTPSCGLFPAYCLSQLGHRPPFHSDHIVRGFMRAFAWSTWGVPSWRLPADIVVLDMGGWHHVTFYVGDNGDGTWACLGAAQGPKYEINIWNFKGAQCVAVRRPAAP